MRIINKENTRRVLWIDVCKILCAYFIVNHHCIQHEVLHPDMFNMLLREGCLGARVYFFFFIAAIFTSKCSGFFHWERAKFILYPLCVWAIVGSLCKAYCSGDGLGILCNPFTLVRYLLIDGNGPLWFLEVLMVFSFITPILRKCNKIKLLIFAFLVYVLSLVYVENTYFYEMDKAVRWIERAMKSFFFFSVGIVLGKESLYKMTDFLKKYCGFILCGSVIIVSLLLMPGISFPLDYPPNDLLVIWGVLQILALGVFVEVYFNKIAGKISHFAQASFFIYATHSIAITLINKAEDVCGIQVLS